MNLIFRNINKIDQFHTLDKNKLDKREKTRVIYKLDCKDRENYTSVADDHKRRYKIDCGVYSVNIE